MKRKIFYLLLTCLLITFTSCSNLMKGSDLIHQLDDLLDEVNAPEVEVLISANGTYGTTAPNGKYLYKVNKKYPIMFQLLSEDYTFVNWEVVDRDTEAPLTNAITFDDATKVETNFTITAKENNFWIRPKCVQYPCVSSNEPKMKSGGVICYTPIEISFNMPMSPQGLNGTFDNIQIAIDDTSIISYFELPILSEDGKKLIIKPKPSISNLVLNATLTDVKVTLSENIKAAANPELTFQSCSYEYRINNSQDVTPPTIKKLVVSKDREQAKEFQKNPDYSSWGENEYSINRVIDSVWISCNALDLDSGIDSIIVTETILNNNDGTPRNYTYPEKTVSREFSVVSTEEFALEPFEYKLSTDINAFVKLNIKVKDRAGYTCISNDYNYYFVTEPVFISDAILKFDIPSTVEGSYNNAVRISENGFDTQFLSKIINIKHNFYKDYYSKIDINISYWDGKEEPEVKSVAYSKNGVLANTDEFELINDEGNKVYKIVRDPTKITTVKMVISDEFGRTYEQIYKIPLSPMIVEYGIDNFMEMPFIKIENIDDSYYDEKISYSILVKKNATEEVTYPLTGSIYYFNPYDFFETENEYTIGIGAYCYENGKCNHAYGCINESYFKTFVFADYDSFVPKNQSSIDASSVVFPSTINVESTEIPEKNMVHFKLSYPDDFIKTPGVIYINGYCPAWENPEDATFEYMPGMEVDLTAYGYNYYYAGIFAYDSNGAYLTNHKYGHFVDNNADGWEDEIDDSFVILDATNNFAPPNIAAERSRSGYEQMKPNFFTFGVMNKTASSTLDTINYATFYSKGFGFDSDKQSHLLNGEPRNGHETVLLDYLIVENSPVAYDRMIPYNSSFDNSFTKRMYVEIPESGSIEKFLTAIPCESADNSFYTIYGRIYDTNGTNTVASLGVISNYVYNSSPVVQKVSESDGANIRIKVDKSKADSGTDIKAKMYSVTNADGNGWLDNNNVLKSSSIGFSNTSMTVNNFKSIELRYKTQTSTTFDIITKNNCSTTFFDNRYMRLYIYTEPTSGTNKEFKHKFFKTVYIYPKYYTSEITCNIKNFIEGANGLQFFIDQPTLVQTLYCKGNLGNDADLWATKAMEADVTVLNPGTSNTCTYVPVTDDEHIPSGNYYCVVVHFADGTSCMSGVKYK